MAYADFEQLRINGHPSIYLRGSDYSGIPVLHTGLPNPLTNAGNVCRYNIPTALGPNDVSVLFCVKSSIQSSSFVNIPSTRAIEMIFSVRMENKTSDSIANNFSVGSSCGLFIKNIQDSNYYYNGAQFTHGYYSNTPDCEGFYGYGIRLANGYNYSNSKVAPHIALWARNPTSSSEDIITTLPGGLGTVSYDKWYTLKIKCIPSGSLQDDLYGYILTGSDYTNPNDYTQIFQKSIANVNPLYIPWTVTGTQRMGFYYTLGSNTNTGASVSAGYYIDRLKFTVKTI